MNEGTEAGGARLARLPKVALPPRSARFAALESAQDKVMSDLDAPFHPWPYVEGMTIDEPCNDLALISARACGDKLPVQIGRPSTPAWKHGFESALAIVNVTFDGKRRPTRCYHASAGAPCSAERVPTRVILMAMLNWLLPYMVDHVQPDRVG